MEKTQEKSIEDRGDLDVWIVREDPRDNKQKSEKTGVSNGMSSCVIPDGSIFLYGGESAPLDSLESFEYSKCFDTQSLKWRNITCTGDLPRRRSWSQLCVLGDRVYLFGGIRRPEQKFLADLYSFRWAQLEHGSIHWELIEGTGELPPVRSSHSLLALGHRLILIGGGNWVWDVSVTPPVPIVEMHDEVYTFNTITKEWRKESSIFDKASDKLAERWGQTACLVDDKIYIFGGQHLRKVEWYNDLYTLETTEWKWEKPKTSGTSPSPRHGHTMNYLNRNLILVGGWGKPDPSKDVTGYFNDIFVFNVDNLHWTQVDPVFGITRTPGILTRICGHCTSLVDNRLIVTGGLTSWSERTPNENAMILWVGPKRLKDICLGKIARTWDYWQMMLERNSTCRMIPQELEEQLLNFRKTFREEEEDPLDISSLFKKRFMY